MSLRLRCVYFDQMADKYFSAQEYTDMIIIYGEAGEDAIEAANLYAERFPGR